MRRGLNIIFFIAITVILSGCGILVKSSKYQLSNGYYTAKSHKTKYTKVYLDNEPDTLSAYYLKKEQKTWVIDTTQKPVEFTDKSKKPINSFLFIQPSFDVDVLTILFKYRPETEGFPNQINASFNGVIYLGYRNDIYHINYKPTPFAYNRKITHYGFSFGAFAGFGSATMNPSVTKNLINIEYDGVAFTKGIAAIVGVGSLSIGVTLGFDNMMDVNHGYWIYENKPWIGLAFGLNLN